jgi:hypothetical protein
MREADPAHLEELAIFFHTPGLANAHVGAMMHWDSNAMLKARRYLPTPDPALVQKNAESITLEDGGLMLRAILDGKSDFAHAPPLHVTRYLQARRQKRATSIQLAREFNTTPARIKRWWRADVFDPLSGRPRPRHLLRRNRPITTSTRRVGLVL